MGRDLREAEGLGTNGLMRLVTGPTSSVGQWGGKGRGPPSPGADSGRSRGGKPGLARLGGEREQNERRNNEEKKQYEHHGCSGPPLSPQT